MARAPLLQLNDISLTFGGDPIFADLSLVVHEGDRVALVGRNGSGKSTLMKVMAGLVEPDRGQRILPPGITVGYMEQDPDFAGFARGANPTAWPSSRCISSPACRTTTPS